MKQKTEPLNESETAWVRTQLENASKFVEGFSPGDADKPLTLAALDRAFAAWIGSEPTEADLINAVINYVGIAFGQALVDGTGLKWVIATDDQGSELAVYGFPGRGDVLIYPANFVAKRWERRETNFLEKAYQQIGQDVRGALGIGNDLRGLIDRNDTRPCFLQRHNWRSGWEFLNGVDHSCFHPVESIVEKPYAEHLAVALQHFVRKPISDAPCFVAFRFLKGL